MFDVYAVTNSQQSATAEFDQVRLERVWGVLQLPVTAKLDWVIKYTGPEAGDLFEPALQAFEQAAAAVLERERLVGQLSQIQQQLAQPGCNHKAQGTMQELSLSAGADRLGICFVIATVQVETAAQVLKVPSPAKVHA
ncbi:Coiled-coil domain-containing protein 87 [Trebouxia sp. C0009 RCD-2024]